MEKLFICHAHISVNRQIISNLAGSSRAQGLCEDCHGVCSVVQGRHTVGFVSGIRICKRGLLVYELELLLPKGVLPVFQQLGVVLAL
jgi:hypothetical protein